MIGPRFYRTAADQGSARAQYNIGTCYKNGFGVDQDDTEAAKWYRLAADQGDADAQYSLGVCYELGEGLDKDEVEAVRLYRLSAEQGNALAQYNLGNCYRFGRGVDKDEVEAARFFFVSAEQGNVKALCKLGFFYEKGLGVDQDDKQAAKWYRLAADQGNAVAQYNLGACYDQGRGVKQDYAEAARLFQLSADQDDVDAQANLGYLYFEGHGVQRNCDTALHLFRRSGETCCWVVDAIEQIDKSASELLDKKTDAQRVMIEAGESVFGQTLDGTGDYALHVAAREMQPDTVALLFDHPSFDDLVLRANTVGELPCDVVSAGNPAKAQSREARALRSILSVSRRTRAACVLWCFEILCNVAPERLLACIPQDIVREIVQYVMPPVAPGSLLCGVTTLLTSPSAWPRPCLATVSQVVAPSH